MKADTEKAVDKTGGGIEPMDVKAALITDGRVDAGNINVDTSASTKTVLLKGSVPTTEQRTMAEVIASQGSGQGLSDQQPADRRPEVAPRRARLVHLERTGRAVSPAGR
ncbi:MAG: BON domain-containing protein [Acidobacteria bacterium]|nr:BON domain-containing protein [Acidobacteriota bacterium]